MALSFPAVGQNYPLRVSGFHTNKWYTAAEMKAGENDTTPKRYIQVHNSFYTAAEKSALFGFGGDTDFSAGTIVDFILPFWFPADAERGAPDFYPLSYYVGADISGTVDWDVSAGLFLPYREDIDPSYDGYANDTARLAAGYAIENDQVVNLTQGHVLRPRVLSGASLGAAQLAYISCAGAGVQTAHRVASGTQIMDKFLFSSGTLLVSPFVGPLAQVEPGNNDNRNRLPWIGLCVRLSSPRGGDPGTNEDVMYTGSHVHLAGSLWQDRVDVFNPVG